MSGCDFRLRPAAGLPLIETGIYGLTAIAVLVTPLRHWLLYPVLLIALAAACRQAIRRYREVGGWELVKDGRCFTLETGRGGVAVNCRFEFIAPLLVVVKVWSGRGGVRRRLILTPRRCDGDHWRRLHICARTSRDPSRMTDDDVLGGKVDGHEYGVPRYR